MRNSDKFKTEICLQKWNTTQNRFLVPAVDTLCIHNSYKSYDLAINTDLHI